MQMPSEFAKSAAGVLCNLSSWQKISPTRVKGDGTAAEVDVTTNGNKKKLFISPWCWKSAAEKAGGRSRKKKGLH